MRHKRFNAVIFDFDYTLGDSSTGIIESINYALGRLGLPTATSDAIRGTIGLSLLETFNSLVGPEHRNGLGNEHRDLASEFDRLFVERADEVMVDSTVLYDAVPEAVDALAAQGLPLGIVSSKFRRRIEDILRRERLLDRFSIIVGSEDVTAHKPSPVGLLMALSSLSSSCASSMYVGDSVIDAETARRASVPFVAVLSGVTPRSDFDAYAVHGILSDVSQVPPLVG